MAFEAVCAQGGVTLERRQAFLRVRFDAEHTIVGFPIVGGTRSTGHTVLWHEVRNGELPVDVDPESLLRARLEAIGEPVAPTFLTSRSLEHVHVRHVRSEDVDAVAIATVGLGNALRVGDTPGDCRMIGTINVLCRVSVPLTEAAMLEAMTVVVEARTVAVARANVASRRSGGASSGTGTDCVIVASPLRGREARYAGKHTAVGHAVGLAVREAVTEGALRWKETTGWR